MAEKSKFTGALSRLSNRPVATGAPTAPSLTTQGRTPGKRSNPEFSPTTFFVRKDTKRKASRLLEDQEQDKDLSDLVEQLLTEWIAKNSNT